MNFFLTEANLRSFKAHIPQGTCHTSMGPLGGHSIAESSWTSTDFTATAMRTWERLGRILWQLRRQMPFSARGCLTQSATVVISYTRQSIAPPMRWAPSSRSNFHFWTAQGVKNTGGTMLQCQVFQGTWGRKKRRRMVLLVSYFFNLKRDRWLTGFWLRAPPPPPVAKVNHLVGPKKRQIAQLGAEYYETSLVEVPNGGPVITS